MEKSGLESAALKLDRAAVHIEAIRDAIWDYTEREPSAIVPQSDGSHKLNFHEGPPDDIAILAGETVYQIRSVLDYLVFDLVHRNLNNCVLPDGWEKRCEFPLFLEVPLKSRNPDVPYELPLPYKCFQKQLPGVSETALAFVERLQPFYRGREGPSQLWLLAQLSNIDKHRHLNILNPQAHIRRETVYEGETSIIASYRAKDGAEVESPILSSTENPAVKMQGGFTPFVSFDESALGEGAATLPLDLILDSCLDITKRIIVPAFTEFLNKS